LNGSHHSPGHAITACTAVRSWQPAGREIYAQKHIYIYTIIWTECGSETLVVVSSIARTQEEEEEEEEEEE
jgi:hypothetical protein